MRAALQIRSFLGLSETDIVHDSIAAGAALSQTEGRLDPSALVLSTRVVGMDPDQARDHVRSLIHLPQMRPSSSDLLGEPPTFH